MKENHKHTLDEISIEAIYLLLSTNGIWKSLNIDYSSPLVERLYTDFQGYRIYLHCIHRTDNQCLYHKHRWASKIILLSGSYEMGITYNPDEISSEDTHKLPTLCKLLLTTGSEYEMSQTDTLHYVRPISDISYSVMITKELYPEADFRKEIIEKELYSLSSERENELINIFTKLIGELMINNI